MTTIAFIVAAYLIGSFFGNSASYSMPMFTTTTEDGLTGQKKV
jgi:hypothetical protein